MLQLYSSQPIRQSYLRTMRRIHVFLFCHSSQVDFLWVPAFVPKGRVYCFNYFPRHLWWCKSTVCAWLTFIRLHENNVQIVAYKLPYILYGTKRIQNAFLKHLYNLFIINLNDHCIYINSYTSCPWAPNFSHKESLLSSSRVSYGERKSLCYVDAVNAFLFSIHLHEYLCSRYIK